MVRSWCAPASPTCTRSIRKASWATRISCAPRARCGGCPRARCPRSAAFGNARPTRARWRSCSRPPSCSRSRWRSSYEDRTRVRLMTCRPRACALTALALLAACGSSPSGGAPDAGQPVIPGSGAPAVQSFSPDVPAWRGGCFLQGDPGKIVNASPSPDVRPFGHAFDCVPGPGGLVYLDRYDPVAGTGDVTVLSSAPGSVPVVIGANGGAGGIVNGSTGARFDDAQARVLTLQDVSFVTGQLVVADLPGGAPAVVANHVRVENYDFLADGGAVYVDNYRATSRTGDLYYWTAGAAPQLVASQASRFDFVMYRLAPARDQVAFLTGWTATAGGDLFVQTLPPGAPAARLAAGVDRMSWTADGHLVYLVRSSDGVTFALWIAGALAPLPASVAYGLSATGQGASALAYVLRSAADPFTGDLSVAALTSTSASATPIDAGVSAAAGFGFAPKRGFVAYARGFENPQSPGSATPQPGIASELKVAAVGSPPAPFVLASSASVQRIAWDPQEQWVAGIESFD